jgi:hypothetical protein
VKFLEVLSYLCICGDGKKKGAGIAKTGLHFFSPFI